MILYVFLSCLLFLGVLVSKKVLNNAISLSILINTIPFILDAQFKSNEVRLVGIPYAYIPILFVVLVYIINIKKINLKKNFVITLVLMLLSVLYIFFSALVRYDTFLVSVPYVFMFLIYFVVFIATSGYFKALSIQVKDNILINFIRVVSFCAFIGVIKYMLNVIDDGNFMPMLNRNATMFIFII
jgi:hypothetical protein